MSSQKFLNIINSLSAKHFYRCMDTESDLYEELCTYYQKEPCDFENIGYINNSGIKLLFKDNHCYTILGVRFRVFTDTTSLRGTYVVMFVFDSHDDYKKLQDKMAEEYKKRTAVRSFYLYKFRRGEWRCCDSYKAFPPENYIGYKSYVKTIVDQVELLTKYADYMSKHNINTSLNFLLYGPPGTGKTSLIRLIAGQLQGLPIYNIDIQALKGETADLFNIRSNNENKRYIMVFEDFDRFLTENKFPMAEILNSLDGLSNTSNQSLAIRFFTANDKAPILANKALCSRFHNFLEFHVPKLEEYKEQFDKLTSDLPVECKLEHPEKIDVFLNKVVEMGHVSLREFTNYVCRNVFYPNYETVLLDNVEQLNWDNDIRKATPKRKNEDMNDD